MSVLIIVTFQVESPDHALKVMDSNSDALTRLTRLSRSGGAISHNFYVDTEGSALVAVDEWESPQAFRDFFDGNGEIEDIMTQAGVRGAPTITILEKQEVAGTF